MMSRSVIILLILLFFTQCRENNRNTGSDFKPGKNEIADMNSYIVRKDRERIQSYIERKGITMKESPTGLWYTITNEGTGNCFKEAERVFYDYNCYLLDGTECYNSKELGRADVIIGRSELPSGLHEGLKMLRPGASALFILPPHLAYGLLGDGKKIPPRSTVVYSITIIK